MTLQEVLVLIITLLPFGLIALAVTKIVKSKRKKPVDLQVIRTGAIDLSKIAKLGNRMEQLNSESKRDEAADVPAAPKKKKVLKQVKKSKKK